MFYNKFVNLCNKKGVSPSAAAEEMGYQRSVVTRWSKGTEPRDATIQRVADYFGVDADYLSGKKEKPTNPKIGELSEEELDIIADLRRLKQADQDAILRMIRSLSASGEK